MVEINRDGFQGIDDPMERDLLLFDNTCGVQGTLKDLKESVDTLAKSPWRMAIPPISWKAIGGFMIIMALIIRGDIDKAFKLLGTLLGVG